MIAQFRLITANICRVLVGVVFIISGLIKLNDPAGTQIKMEEYFEVFAIDFGHFFSYFIPYALHFAVLMCVLEVVLGVALLVGYKPKATLNALLGLVVFFTFLTFYSAYFNKVTDCGCFGDALKLKPWASFSKDLILMVLITVMLLLHNAIKPLFAYNTNFNIVAGSAIASVGLAFYALMYLPPIDFRPYKVGADVPAAMKLPKDAKVDIYQTLYTLKNNITGETKTIDDKTYISSNIWEDSTWVITHTADPVQIQVGDRPKITDFSVTAPNGEDYTAASFVGRHFFIIIKDTKWANVSKMKDIIALGKALESSKDPKIKVEVLTSTSVSDFEAFRHTLQLPFPYYTVDATVLKTIMRTDPGLWLLKDGIVTAKFSFRSVPTEAEAINLLR